MRKNLPLILALTALAAVAIGGLSMRHSSPPPPPPRPPAEEAQRPPPDDELRTLMHTALRSFVGAVARRDFSDFRRDCSRDFRASNTSASLKEAFKEFFNLPGDTFNGLEGAPLIFDLPPAIDREGGLVLSGYAATMPVLTWFKATFTREADAWRISSLKVEVNNEAPKREHTAERPPTDALRRQVHATLVDFAHAVASRDFGALYTQTTTILRYQTDPAKMAAAFADLRRVRRTLSSLKSGGLTIDESKPTDDQGTLFVRGHYETQPTTRFEVKYRYEHPSWRLAAIKVDVGDE